MVEEEIWSATHRGLSLNRQGVKEDARLCQTPLTRLRLQPRPQGGACAIGAVMGKESATVAWRF